MRDDSYVQFFGETPWEAIVSHESLDLEEEQDFLEFCEKHGAGPESDEWTLRRLYAEFLFGSQP